MQRLRLNKMARWLALWLVVGLWGWLAAAAAQNNQPSWADPINLSQSGFVAHPQLFQDHQGGIHILWQDNFRRAIFYVTGNGTTWSEPEIITPPFGVPLAQSTAANPAAPIIPHYVTDNNGIVHTFWRNDEDNLRYGRVPLADFGDGSLWSPTVTLANDVTAFAVTSTPTGQLALLYIRIPDNPAIPTGVYYQGSTDGGITWENEIVLYESLYFRLLSPDDNFLAIAPGTQPRQLVATWDDVAQEAIYTSQSTNGGSSWSDPEIVDSREETDLPGSVRPLRLQLIARQGIIHRLWVAGHQNPDTPDQGPTCALYHSWSTDHGQSWTPRTHVLDELNGCIQTAHLFADSENRVWLLATTADTAMLQLWTANGWGEPQMQQPAVQLIDRQSLRPLTVSCQQPAITPNGNLVLLGCASSLGQDAWLLSRPLGDLEVWQRQELDETIWQVPVMAYQDSAAITELTLVGNQINQPHLFWVQPQRRTADNDPGTVFYSDAVIYHTIRLNDSWIAAAPVIQAPEGEIEEIAVTISREDRLLVVWSNPQSGQLFFSQVNSQQAIDSSQWSTPFALPVPIAAATAPDIGVMDDGTIVVAYVVPINEGRGVYLVTSQDQGFTWSEPVQVFDGAAANWAMLDQPHIAFTNGTHIHLIWRHLSLPPTSEPLALYYARSTDSGQSWSAANPVVSGDAVVWSELVGWSTTQIHIVWRELQSGRTTLWHTFSVDDGLTLERPSRITTFEDLAGPTSLTIDLTGQLHLFQITHPLRQPPSLLPFVWEEGFWLPEQELDLTLVTIPDEARLASGLSSDGELILAASGKTGGLREEQIWVSGRTVSQPDVTPTPLPTLTATPEPTATATPTATPTAEPTVDFPRESEDANSPKIGPMTINSTTDGIVIGVFLAASFVGVVFLWGLRANRRGK